MLHQAILEAAVANDLQQICFIPVIAYCLLIEVNFLCIATISLVDGLDGASW